MKKIITSILIVGALATTLVGCGNTVDELTEDSGPDFQFLYDMYCDHNYSWANWASIGEDGSYLSIDTNPRNIDEDDDLYILFTFDSEGISAIENINAELGLPDSLLHDMRTTTSLMGQQSETYSDIGVTVTWTFHPNKGLEVNYKKIA